MARQGRHPGVAETLVLVRAARQLVTLRGAAEPRRGAKMSDLAIVPDGALLIRNGRVDSIGTTRRIERLKAARDAVEVDATGSVVLPAFVDSTTRILESDGKRSVLEAGAKAVLSGMVRHGTVTVEVQVPLDLRVLRLCASLQGRPGTVIPTLVLSEGITPLLLETAVRLGLAQSATVVVRSEGATTESMREFLARARASGLPIKIQSGPGCSARAVLLAFECQPGAISGLESLSGATIRALARAGTVVEGLEARQLIDEGGALALGTHFDNGANRNYNMVYTLCACCRDQGITPAEAIAAGTVNAAYAAGCGSTHGSLDPGKWADLVLYDCRDDQDIIRGGSINQVVRVLRRGRTLYRRGRVEFQ